MNPEAAAYEATIRLRAVRSYADRPVTPEHTQEILEAGRWTGSSTNSQPWDLVVVIDTDNRSRLAEAGRFTGPLRAAPLVVTLVGRPRGSGFDTGRQAQNMMLAAAALGIGSCPVTLHDEQRARSVLSVPQDHRCRYAVAFGYPAHGGESLPSRAKRAFIRKGRRPASDVVHLERFGNH